MNGTSVSENSFRNERPIEDRRKLTQKAQVMLLKKIEESVLTKVVGLVSSGGYRSYLGSHSEQLSAELRDLFTKSNCVLASSGTAALEIALRALGVEAGDEVFLSAYDYPGNFWAIERVGAVPVLVDTAENSWSICPDSLRSALSQSKAGKVVIAAHLHGEIQNASQLREVCDDHGLHLIEDCCQSIGAKQDGVVVGKLADAAIVSFGGGKLISAGRGGALLTSNEQTAQRAKLASGAGSGPYACSEIQAAVASAQLPFLHEIATVTCQFFWDLGRELESRLVELGQRNQQVEAKRLEVLIPGMPLVAQGTNSLYQLGLLLPVPNTTSNASANEGSQLVGSGQGTKSVHRIGTGFSGFHRRSSRRCRKPVELTNSPTLNSRTVTIHHSVALEQQANPETLVENLIQIITAKSLG